jgi:mannobiose 2-epimerase
LDDGHAAERADLAFEVLTERLRDPLHGGYFWSVPSSREPGEALTLKSIYGQAFALFGLTEYAKLGRSSAAPRDASALFHLILDRADAEGTYPEAMSADWSPARPGIRSPSSPHLAGEATLNTHLHLLEAFDAYAASSASEDADRAVVRLLELLSHPKARFADTAGDAFSAGHAIEATWMKLVARKRLRLLDAIARKAALDEFLVTVDIAFDTRRGGVFAGMRGGVLDRTKIWWVQAEGLLCSLHLWLETRDERARTVFLRTLDWIERRQVDWRVGEWRAEVRGLRDRKKPLTGEWKVAYHTGRAAIESHRLLGEAGAISNDSRDRG